MSSGVRAVDRVVFVLLGVLFIAVGVASILWQLDVIGADYVALTPAPLQEYPDQTWWPWAIGIGGAVLLLVALMWLMAHSPQGGSNEVRIPGSGHGGRFTATVVPILDAAAESLRGHNDVEAVHATMKERKTTAVLARFDVQIYPGADLRSVAESAERTANELRAVVGRRDMECLFMLKTANQAATRELA